MDYAKYIAGLEAARKEKHERMRELRQKAMDEGRSLDTAEAEETDTLAGEIKTIDEDLARTRSLKAIEDAAAESAKPVDDKQSKSQPISQGGHKVPVTAKDTTKLDAGIAFARVARVKALAFTGQAGTRDEKEIAQNLYPGDERLVQSVTKATVAAANTLTGNGAWAGNLINDGGAAFADFVEYLRERSLFGQISPRFRRLPFDTPVLMQATAGSAQWVKEGAAKPLTKWTYSRAKLAPLKVAAIAAATKETLMRASISADALLRDELARAVNARIDGSLISDAAAVADESPAGLLNNTSPLTLGGDGSVAGIRCDIAQFLKEMVGDNLSIAGAFWVMPETTAIDLSLATNEVGAPAFPGITPNGGTLAGLPVFTSQYVPTETEGPVVALIKGDEIFLGDEGGVQVSVSDQASLVMADDPSMNSTTPTVAQTVSMWQTNSVAFLVERFVNWQKRRAESVVWAHVNWDACAST